MGKLRIKLAFDFFFKFCLWDKGYQTLILLNMVWGTIFNPVKPHQIMFIENKLYYINTFSQTISTHFFELKLLKISYYFFAKNNEKWE